MSMHSRWYETLDYIKSNDTCMYKMALYILNDDEYLAIEFLKSKFGFGSAVCHRIFLEIKKTYSVLQLRGLVKYIEKHTPEYAI